ncbi:MAG: cytochrome c oxidase subunit II [Chloroflexi bacterium]|nr:cytochrome c oxidase subunit II [Chloroflexota bacterium]
MPQLPLFPQQASTVAGQVDFIFAAEIALGLFFTTIVVILIIYFGIRYRRGARVDRSNPPDTNLKVELSWMLGLLVLGMGSFLGAASVYFNINTPPADALDIYVVGQQWMWKAQHPEGRREINELHVPVNVPVRLTMISQDVIHSFFIPAFRLKYDVIPGRYTNLWFEATRPGEYHLFCAEYCGTNHSRMIGKVVVMEQSDYQAWLSSGTAAEVPLSDAGEQLFSQLGCSGCHTGEPNATAPDLAGIFGQPRPLESGENVIADESYIRESILFPSEKIVAGYAPIMPTYEGRITEEQLLELVAYIQSLGAGAEGQQ